MECRCLTCLHWAMKETNDTDVWHGMKTALHWAAEETSGADIYYLNQCQIIVLTPLAPVNGQLATLQAKWSNTQSWAPWTGLQWDCKWVPNDRNKNKNAWHLWATVVVWPLTDNWWGATRCNLVCQTTKAINCRSRSFRFCPCCGFLCCLWTLLLFYTRGLAIFSSIGYSFVTSLDLPGISVGGEVFLALLDYMYVSRAHGIAICPSSVVRPSVRVAIISELNAWISFKF